MTVLEWLKASTRYSFEDNEFIKIALERGVVAPDADLISVLTQEQKDLMTADIIFVAVMLSPSSTPSLTQSHNGFESIIGSESDAERTRKIAFAKSLYKKYDDPKYDILNDTQGNISFIEIEDVI